MTEVQNIDMAAAEKAAAALIAAEADKLAQGETPVKLEGETFVQTEEIVN